MFTIILLFLWYGCRMDEYMEEKRKEEIPEMSKSFVRNVLFTITLILDSITTALYIYILLP